MCKRQRTHPAKIKTPKSKVSNMHIRNKQFIIQGNATDLFPFGSKSLRRPIYFIIQ